MALIVLLNKPFDVLCQFTDGQGRQTLADFIQEPRLSTVYPAGRLDRDSEGLVVLTNNGQLQHQIANPKLKTSKEYWAQVEGDITEAALQQLATGVELKDGPTLPALASKISSPEIWPRSTPIRERQHIPTSWLKLEIHEGRNRQVRRMCAAIGFPCLRLIRMRVGQWSLQGPLLQPGAYQVLDVADPPEPASTHKFRKNNKKPSSTRKHGRNKF